MPRLIGMAGLALVLSVTAGSATAPKKVHVAAGVEGTEQEAETYLKANLKIIQKDLPEAIRVCAKGADAALVRDFEFAVEVGKGGKVGKTVPTPSNAFTTCVTRAVAALKFSEPPRSPLGVYFEVAIRE